MPKRASMHDDAHRYLARWPICQVRSSVHILEGRWWWLLPTSKRSYPSPDYLLLSRSQIVLLPLTSSSTSEAQHSVTQAGISSAKIRNNGLRFSERWRIFRLSSPLLWHLVIWACSNHGPSYDYILYDDTQYFNHNYCSFWRQNIL